MLHGRAYGLAALSGMGTLLKEQDWGDATATTAFKERGVPDPNPANPLGICPPPPGAAGTMLLCCVALFFSQVLLGRRPVSRHSGTPLLPGVRWAIRPVLSMLHVFRCAAKATTAAVSTRCKPLWPMLLTTTTLVTLKLLADTAAATVLVLLPLPQALLDA